MEPMGEFSSNEWDTLSMLFSNEDLHYHMCVGDAITQNPNFRNSSLQQTSYCINADQYSGGSYNCYDDPMQVWEDPQMDSFQMPDYRGTVMDDKGVDQIQPLQPVDVPETGKSRVKRKTKSEADISDLTTVEEEEENSKKPKKKTRISKDMSKKKTQPRKKRKSGSDLNEAEDRNAKESQLSNMCSSEDDTVSQELNGELASALISDGKPRANRGAATDPQSLYARKRRERINERLRILQNLVPNGTKVDISTMLEEAVHYVKFLQLQIKLLSSDDMWMYAPIAYNGMDIGLTQILQQRL